VGARVTARAKLAALAGPAVFGLFDGLTSLIGVLLPLWDRSDPAALVHTALGLALAEAVGMAAGDWLSDSDEGPAAACVIGAATGLGTLLPTLPYALLPADAARPACLAAIATLTLLIALVRARQRGLRRALAETVLVLLAATVAVYGGTRISGP
jgi:VIT1/CCC1 family predicted Fe2+/Mn2+ transporter